MDDDIVVAVLAVAYENGVQSQRVQPFPKALTGMLRPQKDVPFRVEMVVRNPIIPFFAK